MHDSAASEPDPQRELFAKALSLPVEQRGAFVRREAGEDLPLCEAVLDLLAAVAQAQTVAKQVAAEPAADSEDVPHAAAELRSTATADLMRRLAASPKLDTDRYHFDGEVDRGGMGAILRIHDRQLNRWLAMKVLLDRPQPRDELERQLSHQLLGRFLEEAQVTSQLDHPGVVPVHELGLDKDGKVYFTMRLVKGRTASEVFRQAYAGEEGWTVTRALEVILKVCDTMAFAHDKGILHRDLKPDNVMVGRFGEVYVMDWGLAKVVGQESSHDVRIKPQDASAISQVDSVRKRDSDSDDGSSVVSMDGQKIGTPSYMPPEQARSEELDQRADVYAIGAMMYRLLSGRDPYTTPGLRTPAYHILKDVAEGRLQPITELQSGVPAELLAIVDKAMARDRAHRYADTTLLAQDLRAFVDQRAVKAYRTGALVELTLWVKRNRPFAATLVAALLILLGGILGIWGYANEATIQAAKNARLANDMRDLAIARKIALARGVDRSRPDWHADALAHLREAAAFLEGDGAAEKRWEYRKALRNVAVEVCNAVCLSGKRETWRIGGIRQLGPNGRYLLAAAETEVTPPIAMSGALGRILGSRMVGDAPLRVFDLADMKEVTTNPRPYTPTEQPLAIGHDGQDVLFSSAGRVFVLPANAVASERRQFLELGTAKLHAARAAFSGDGRHLAVYTGPPTEAAADEDAAVLLWQTAELDQVSVLPRADVLLDGHLPDGCAMTFSEAGDELLVWNGRSGVAVFDVAERTLTGQRQFDQEMDCCPCFAGAHGVLVSTMQPYGSEIVQWHPSDDSMGIRFRSEGPSRAIGLSFDSANDRAAILSQAGLSIHRLVDGDVVAAIALTKSEPIVGAVSFVNDGARVAWNRGHDIGCSTVDIIEPVSRTISANASVDPIVVREVAGDDWEELVRSGAPDQPLSDPARNQVMETRRVRENGSFTPTRALVGWTISGCAVDYMVGDSLAKLRFISEGKILHPFDPDDPTLPAITIEVRLWSDKATTSHPGLILVWKIPEWELQRAIPQPVSYLDHAYTGTGEPLGFGDLFVGKAMSDEWRRGEPGSEPSWQIVDSRLGETLFRADGPLLRSIFVDGGASLDIYASDHVVRWDLERLNEVFADIGCGMRHEPHPLDSQVEPAVARAIMANMTSTSMVAAIRRDASISEPVRARAIERAKQWPTAHRDQLLHDLLRLLFVEKGGWQRALALWAAVAADRRSDEPLFRLLLAVAQFRCSEPKLALATLSEDLSDLPDEWRAAPPLLRALACHELGDHDGADEAAEVGRAAAKGSDHQYTRMLLRQLDRTRPRPAANGK